MVVILYCGAMPKITVIPRLSSEQHALYETLKVEILHDIQTGLESFQRAGQKMLRIRDERLYREEFDTFEAFCRTVLGHSKTYANNLIIGYELCQDLIRQGETVLPDSERMARKLAQFPSPFWGLIWKRARQIADRGRPTYQNLRDAGKEIVPSRQAQQVWQKELIDRLRTAKRALTVSVDFSGFGEHSMKTVATLLVEIEKAVSELSVHAGKRIEQIKRK